MQRNNEASNKAHIIGNILIYFAGLVLLASSATKFAHVPKVVNELGSMGFDGNRLMLVAILELLSALIFMLRPTRAAGLLLASAYLGGAIATHVQHASSPAPAAFILTVLWLGAWLRHPQVLWSLSLHQVQSGEMRIPGVPA